ncbi:alpha-L-fucosidase [Paludisphaera mucosa]|uniref:alpha-L-fucosidase n=1 Tax=Paludisphaera mucosa TaxID=3030827 RepID=A0ABT6F7U5_9BACT|nr:alpha-L-fucosidase [Paludisphaera mucosa]MDG3003653.1 alpha-L-fucosidase [Paludisphaera mucosa]
MKNRSGIGVGVAATLAFGAALAALAPQVRGQAAAAKPEDSPNALARRWFEDAKFGLFVHWGVYSLLGKGEWVMNNDKIPIAEYRKLPPQFNPVKFDADEWVKLAKSAGMRYITVTTKHHDGFCMYDSKLTDYDVVDATPYGKDPIKALAAACRKHRIKLFFYYSLLDWHHPDYYPWGMTGHDTGREKKGDWAKYVAYYQGQVRELCTNYGEIGGVWFDGWWDLPKAAWDLEGTYRIIHELQPGALVGNNHHVAPFPGEDFQMFEQDLPGENSAGFNKADAAAALPLETCLTMNDSWGYNSKDDHFKSPEQVVHALVGAAGRGANLLLNVGPRPDGAIGPEFAERLLTVGRWLEGSGKTIYGSRRGPIPPKPWGVSTVRGALGGEAPEVFLHILKPDVNEVTLPEVLATSVAFPLGKSTPLKTTAAEGGVKLTIPADARAPYDTILSVTAPMPDQR